MKTCLAIALLFTCYLAGAQDTIIKQNGDLIKAKITEIGTEEVKFKIYGIDDGPIVIMKKGEIKLAKVAGQVVIGSKENIEAVAEDALIKKSGETLKVKVIEIGTDEVRFRLLANPDGPVISIKKSEIKQLKVQGQVVIDGKGGAGPDIITKKDGSEVKAKILEIGESEVKYKLHSSPDGPTLSMKKSDIKNIKIDGQSVYDYRPDPYSMSNTLILDKNSSLKFHFFSPLNKNLAFTYEWMIKPGFNWEVGFGIIGVGKSISDGIENSHPVGAFIRTGPKFLIGSSSDVEIAGQRYAHPLKGRYFKIEAAYSNLSTTINKRIANSNLFYEEHNSYSSAALMLIYGRQFIIGNTITLEWHIGLGYGFESKTSNQPNNNLFDFDPRRYAFSYFGPSFPIAFTSGFNLGYIFKTPLWLENMFRKPSMRTRPPTRNSMDNKPQGT